MPERRRAVFKALAATSDATTGETTTVGSLAAGLGEDRDLVESHLAALVACELARRHDDGRVRVTVTGEELLELDAGGLVIVEQAEGRREP